MAVDASADKNALMPRYRRVLGVGALLDECIRLFRDRWRTFAVFSAVSLVPLGVVSLGVSLAFAATLQPSAFRGIATPGPQQLQQLGQLFAVIAVFIGLVGIASGLIGLIWTAAITATTDAIMREERPTIGRVYGIALRRLLALIGGSFLIAVAIGVLSLVAMVLFVITLFGLGTLIALVCLIVWATRPAARKVWLKWLIVLTFPFGLPMFFFVRWSMFVPAIVLERRGPMRAMERSQALVSGQWFHVAGVLAVASLIVGVLVSAPSYLVSLPLSVAAQARGTVGPDPIQSVATQAVSLVCQVVFASIGTIAYTLLFTDLRNRREGADLAERVRQLEMASVPP
ncbi:MAG: hypothetical protein JOZ81_29585 [Chloroflexi bacterium]|nr:hypothetical protein [Chloroflexota bacterium]